MKFSYIGTSGYYYYDWKGPFYLKNVEKNDFPGYYAQFNFSYYQKVKRIFIVFNNDY